MNSIHSYTPSSSLLSHHSPSYVSTIHDSSLAVTDSQTEQLQDSHELRDLRDLSTKHTSIKKHNRHFIDMSDDIESNLQQPETQSLQYCDIQKNRVIGRLDFEKCICEILPKYSKSQCVTHATRLFDKLASEEYVSKTMDGPCCTLYVLGYENFLSSLNLLGNELTSNKDERTIHESLI